MLRQFKRRIDVETEFKSRVLDPSLKPPDYTDYPGGDVKVSVPVGKFKGIIAQTGTHKRNYDKFQEKVKGKMKQIPPGQYKPVQNVGILLMFDRFFNWLNKALGS